MKVLKFGGKSLATYEKTQKICKYIKKIYKNDKKLIIVVSAIGNKTNELINLANEYSNNNPCKTELAKLLCTGEIESAALFAMALIHENLPAKSFSALDLDIETFGDPLDSRIAYINKSKLEKELSSGTICVVAGFQGINKDKQLTTLGRGGSDTTAAALAAIFGVDAEIYSDFDGVFAGDPRENNFKKLNQVDYQTMIDMAECGAKVLSARSTEIAKEYNIQIISKSSSAPNKKGTIISSLENDVISLTNQNHLCLITIIFNNRNKLDFIIKNVLLCLKDYNFYNLRVENSKISFLVQSAEKSQIINNVSSKLKILKK